MAEEKTNKLNKIGITDYFFLAVLALFPFLHVNSGLDAADVGYNLLNFTVFPNMNRTWAISTLVANIFGHVMTFLPGGKTMVGLTLYCTLLGSAFIVFFYLFLRKHYPSLIVFFGLLLAEGFSWCPRVILYHYLSYFFFCTGAILLLMAIEKEKKFLYAIAGAVLAFNVFVRFPNIIECLLIVVLFLYGILEKKFVWKEFLLCVGGYLAMLLAGVGIISIAYGKSAYFDMIKSLFRMTGEATSYTPKSMLMTIFGDYLEYIRYFVPYLLLALGAGAVVAFLKKTALKAVVFAGVSVVFAGISILLKRRYGAFNFSYIDYRSFFMWGTFLLMMALFFAAYNIFKKDIQLKRKLFGMTVIAIVMISPIGSNNGLYSAFNNMFLVGAYLLGELYFLGKKTLETLREEKISAGRKIASGIGLSLAFTGLLICLAALFQSSLFQITFLFHDTSFVNGKFATVSDNPVIAGVRTDAENAGKLQELNDYLNENSLKHKKAVCFDKIPGFYYFFEEECALSHSWAGLDSFPTEELRQDLERLNAEREKPLVILETDLEKTLVTGEEEPESEKKKMLYAFLKENGYYVAFHGQGYIVCLPGEDIAE